MFLVVRDHPNQMNARFWHVSLCIEAPVVSSRRPPEKPMRAGVRWVPFGETGTTWAYGPKGSEVAKKAADVRANMARLRELRLAKEAQEVRTEISAGNQPKPKPKKRFR